MIINLEDIPRILREWPEEPKDPWYRRLWQWLRSDGLGRETARQGRG